VEPKRRLALRSLLPPEKSGVEFEEGLVGGVFDEQVERAGVVHLRAEDVGSCGRFVADLGEGAEQDGGAEGSVAVPLAK